MRKLAILALTSLALFGLMPHASAQVALDPCFSNTPKSTAFANITTATTTALVAPSGTTKVYVCWVAIVSFSTTTANTILLEQGTGAACAGTPTAMTATFNTGVAAAASDVINLGVLAPTGAGGGVCAVTTIGSTPVIGITITFIQQ